MLRYLACLWLAVATPSFQEAPPPSPPPEAPAADSSRQEAPPQEPKAQEQTDEGFRIGVAVNQVFLSVNARSVSGGFVNDMKQDDFLVFEDGRLQKIENFYSEQVPVKVVLLIDASGSTRFSQVEIRKAALEFVKRLGPEDQVAIISFNHQAKLILDFTSDLADIQLALDSIYARGNTVLNDALYVSFDDLLRGIEGKSAVILLTDGIDTGSVVSFDQALNLALRSESSVYVVSKVDEYRAYAISARQELQSFGQFVPKELQDDYIMKRKEDLRRLANLTGGRMLETAMFNSLTDVYKQVAEELKNQYYLSYVPTNPVKDGSWREIDVKVARSDVVVSSRRGYFAAGPLTSNP